MHKQYKETHNIEWQPQTVFNIIQQLNLAGRLTALNDEHAYMVDPATS